MPWFRGRKEGGPGAKEYLVRVFTPRREWFSLARWCSPVLILYLGWQAWDYLAPHKPELAPPLREVVDQVTPSMAEDLRQTRQGVEKVALLHLENDESDYVTNQLRSTIENTHVFDLTDRAIGERFRNMLRMRHPGYGDESSAIERGRKLGVQKVLFGTVHDLVRTPSGVRSDVELRLVDVPGGHLLFSHRYVRDSTTVLANLRDEVGRVTVVQRFLGWVVVVLLLPVFTISFIRAIVRRRTNRANAFVLGVYTAVDAVLAYLLVGANLPSSISMMALLAAVGAAFAYNVSIMSFALRLEGEA